MRDKKTVYEMGVFVCEMKEKSRARSKKRIRRKSDLTILLLSALVFSKTNSKKEGE